jgi:dynamin 1-like protein
MAPLSVALLPSSHSGQEWGEFLHLPGQKFYDFSEIRAEIERETDRLTGKNKGISNKSINLRIFSPYVLNLTLVDLPGITKVPTGDQPEDVEQQILAMCYEFISNPNAIILAVSAANQDLVNSEGIKLARSVDPEGVRTIGVLTKVDIMDHGTDCTDVLNNQVIPLRRGYIAVVNRSQKDILENLPIRTGIAKETKYFQTHPKYRNMLAKCGTQNLARTLNQMLMVHIRDCLPEIKAKINKMLQGVCSNIASLGECLDDQGTSAKSAMLLRIVAQFAANFSNKVDGKGSSELSNEMTELYGGARIAFIFNEVFGKRLKSLDPFEGLSDEDIRTAIANANGTRPSLFVPEISFDLLVRKQIARLEQPGLDCLDKVQEEMLRMVGQSETLELTRFPDLRDRTFEIVHQLLRDCMSPAQKMISNLIAIELAYINTPHPDFVGGKAAVTAAQQSRKLQHGPGGPPGTPAPAGAGAGGAPGQPSNHRDGARPTYPAANIAPFTSPAPAPHAPASTAASASANDGPGGFFGFFQSPSGKTKPGNNHNGGSRTNVGGVDLDTSDLGMIRLPQVRRSVSGCFTLDAEVLLLQRLIWHQDVC